MAATVLGRILVETMWFSRVLGVLVEFLDHPRKVFAFCLASLVFSALFDGTVYRLYGFYMQEDRLRAQIAATELDLERVQLQVEQSRKPEYLERLARERFSMVGEDELMFLFDE